MAAQLNLPNIGASRSWRGRWGRFVLRSRPGSYLLRGDGLKEFGVTEPVVGRRNLGALLDELGIAAGVERRGRLVLGLRPLREVLRRDGMDLKIHVGKSVAAEVRG